MLDIIGWVLLATFLMIEVILYWRENYFRH